MSFTFVQEKPSGSNSASQNVVFDNAVGAGSLILVSIRDSGGGGSGSNTVTDNRGSTYTLARQVVSGAGTTRLYAGITGSGGSCTVAIGGGSGTFARVHLTEFSTTLTSTTPDATNAGSGAPISSPLSTGAVTPTNATALIFAVISTSADNTFTGAGAGWTLLTAFGGRARAAYRVESAVAAYSAVFAWSGGGLADAGAVIAAYSVADSGPSPSTPAFGRYGVRGPIR
jgi:hypothetical protein